MHPSTRSPTMPIDPTTPSLHPKPQVPRPLHTSPRCPALPAAILAHHACPAPDPGAPAPTVPRPHSLALFLVFPSAYLVGIVKGDGVALLGGRRVDDHVVVAGAGDQALGCVGREVWVTVRT